MSDIFFDGDYLQLIKYDEENAKGHHNCMW